MMHAWSEVEHDLVYKPLQGELSEDEYAILDELNGLVLTGEIALERLKNAGQRRLSETEAIIFNRYDLSSLLLNNLRHYNADESHLGRVDLLYSLIERLELKKVSDIRPYLEFISSDLETRPIADQIIDEIIGASKSNYEAYMEIKGRLDNTSGMVSDIENGSSVAILLSSWIKFENTILKKFPEISEGVSIARVPNFPKMLAFLRDKEIVTEYEYTLLRGAREIRNRIVHDGGSIISAKDMHDSAKLVNQVIDKIEKLGLNN